MLKFIHSNFEIDLSNYEINIVEENHWFNDQFFTFYTLPFTFYITDELNAAMGDILSYNSTDEQTYFTGHFYHKGEEASATFDIEDIIDRVATASISFGLEDLPNYTKKLSELPLDDFELEAPNTIYTHAQSVIDKSWPDVTHNFVQVHTDKFDTSEAQWEAFEGVLNKRVSGAFVTNTYDAGEDKQLNRNIMQPQPYLLYVLQKAIEDAGFTMAGDILTDVSLKKALFSEISSYYHTINTAGLELYMHSGEHYGFYEGNVFGKYKKSITLTEKGRYKIAGNLTIRRNFLKSWDKLTLNGNRIWFTRRDFKENYQEYTRVVDINIDFFTGTEAVIEYTSEQYIGAILDGEFIPNQPICDLTITQLSKMDVDGTLLPTLIFPNAIKLQKCVPNMTVGDLTKIIKNWKNFDFNPVGKTMYVNYIENQLSILDAKDLSDFEVKSPQRLFSRGKSYHLKFQDVSSDDYTFESVFVSINGVVTSNIETTEDTSEIIINAIPLPILNRNNVITAHHFVDDDSKLKVILYEGAPAIENVAEDPFDILIPQIYDAHYEDWLNFRINAQSFKWTFKMYEEQIRSLSVRDKVFGYRNYHIIKSLSKDLIKPGIWLIEIETESLKHRIE